MEEDISRRCVVDLRNGPNKPIKHLLFVINYVELNVRNFCPMDDIVQELCESRGGRPGLSVLTSLLVSVDVKNY